MSSFDVSLIRGEIESILTAPDLDVQTISSKQVRRMLAEKFPEMDMKAHKALLKAEIVSAFRNIHGEVDVEGATSPPPEQPSTHSSPAPSAAAIPESKTEKAGKKKKKEEDEEMSDSEYARQLNAELNGRSSRRVSSRANGSGRTSSAVKKTGGRKRGAGVKSSEMVEDSDASTVDEPASSSARAKAPVKKRKKKADGEEEGGKRKGPGEGKGFNKLCRLSPALSDFMGEEKLSRPQVVKRLWEYIKANDLQIPTDKRKIRCDERLKTVFDRETVDSFKMNKYLTAHIWKDDE
ncbi:SWIB-domain-containing protein [Atractiella rhizophila]|nr:SWIB-domain-containing protein [Atractiella rhizophila]